ncbi:MAG: LarC family nickel insertion protein [Geminicoccaceae bacterium]|nr:LarC family nickel insertion protein [Geminicoccaceae bacterium]
MPSEPVAHVHLDPVGGIAGDMFVAALCHARPELRASVEDALARAGLPEGVRARFFEDRRGGIVGQRFAVAVEAAAPPAGSFSAVLARLEAAPLDPAVRRRAAAIYRRLAEAEAAVHGTSLDAVHFHELADWDSFVDVLAAATLIEALPRAGWSVGPLPAGSGFVRTAHGWLPVPAPATLRLLEGFAFCEDGIEGERVTPTGAAILAELGAKPAPPPRPMRLSGSGHGLGARELAGKPNLLRARLFAEPAATATTSEPLAVLRFEVDDQTAEDLACGLERLRAHDGVRDVCQWPVAGKKGRLASAVQVVCAVEAVEAVVAGCLRETTTLGVRVALGERRVLPRETVAVEVAGRRVRVKRARRPDGTISAKAELSDLAESGADAAGRARLRRAAEARALGTGEEEP